MGGKYKKGKFTRSIAGGAIVINYFRLNFNVPEVNHSEDTCHECTLSSSTL